MLPPEALRTMSRELATGIATLIMVLVNGVVGVSLLRTALRTRQAPELLIGMGLFGLGPVSTGLSVLAGTGRVPAGEVHHILHAFSALGSAVGMACVFGFVSSVFRPGVAWARALTGLAVITLAVTCVGSVTAVAMARPEVPSREVLHGWGSVVLVAFTLAFGWAALESGSFYLAARKRLRLGLIEAGVANRFLLWGIASGSAFGLGVCLTLFQLDGMQLTGNLVPSLLIMGVSLITATTMYLAFLPPRAYLAWVERRTPAPAG